MRVVFLGTPGCAVPSLKALAEAGHELTLVVCQPDRPVGRSAAPKPPPVKVAAQAHGLRVVQPRKIRTTEFREALGAARPDVLVVVAYGRILPPAVLEVPRLAAVNVHFSLLPAYRGAAPVQWALARGETITGVTTMLMSEGLDEGDILLQQEVAIERGEHAPALTTRLADTGAALLLETLRGLEAGTIEPRPQDHSRASHAPILRRDDGVADFSFGASQLEGRVRGFDPWPGVWASKGGRRIRVLEARALESRSAATAVPGSVVRLEREELIVACGGGTELAIHRVQPEGRRPITARDAVNGRQLLPGDRLEGGPA